MDPIIINFPAISVDNIFTATATTVDAGDAFPLNGGSFTNIDTGATEYFYEFEPGIAMEPWIVNQTATDYSGVQFTVVGLGNYNQVLTEVQAGPTATDAVRVATKFKKITSITADADVTNVSIGISGRGNIDITTDYWNKNAQYSFNYSNFVNTTAGGPDITQTYSPMKPMAFENGVYQYNPLFSGSLLDLPLAETGVVVSPDTVTAFPITDVTTISMSGIPVGAFHAFVSPTTTTDYATDVGTGSFTMTFMQQGARY